MKNKQRRSDVIIVGSGVAGMVAALELSKTMHVTLLTKTEIGSGNTEKAQGGIAAAIRPSLQGQDLHVQDTLAAGNECNDEHAVRRFIREAPHVMEVLLENGVPFDKDKNGNYQLAREGAHSCRRIFHAGGDATGHWLMHALKEALPKHIEVFEHFMAHDLHMINGVCRGIVGRSQSGEHTVIQAPHTVLAAGGCGQLYTVTSNAVEATGDGYAMAFRAGAELSDMEFLQFHPTMLYVDGQGRGLLSEAIRGDGGTLVDSLGKAVMKGQHPLGDLAPRDVVAKAVYETIKEGKEVFLSIQRIHAFESKFPSITKRLKEQGVDVKKGLLPVRPGAHFMMGGVKADPSGETTVPGLYAIGEAACTGMHGANRLASNSLLEGAAAALLLSQKLRKTPVSENGQEERTCQERQWRSGRGEKLPEKRELQEKMNQWAGIMKREADLKHMLTWLSSFQDAMNSPVSPEATKEEAEVKNMLTTARLITEAALARTETRGAHIREEYPAPSPAWKEKKVCFEYGNGTPAVRKRQTAGRREKEAVR